MRWNAALPALPELNNVENCRSACRLPVMLQNKKAYDTTGVARIYAAYSHLLPPEETILRVMLPHLPSARMLDLGVGGGRTTLHFAKWVREYVGADYAGNMIAECTARFVGYPKSISFTVCDATSMKMFEDNLFDFILFSYNGIDSVSHEDRLKILQEVSRVGKAGGHFCFSSHNLNWAANLFELGRIISFNPKLLVRTAKRLVLRYVYNRSMRTSTVREAAHLVINDGTHRRTMQMYYIRPLAQLAQLEDLFTDIRVFSFVTGNEISPGDLQHVEDMSLYYLCKIR